MCLVFTARYRVIACIQQIAFNFSQRCTDGLFIYSRLHLVFTALYGMKANIYQIAFVVYSAVGNDSLYEVDCV